MNNSCDKSLWSLGTILDKGQQLRGLHANIPDRILNDAQDDPLCVPAGAHIHVRQVGQ